MKTMTESIVAARIRAGINGLQSEIDALREKYPRAVASLSSLVDKGATLLNELIGTLSDEELTAAAQQYIDGLPICGNCIALTKERLGLASVPAGVALPSLEEIIAGRTWL